GRKRLALVNRQALTLGSVAFVHPRLHQPRSQLHHGHGQPLGDGGVTGGDRRLLRDADAVERVDVEHRVVVHVQVVVGGGRFPLGREDQAPDGGLCGLAQIFQHVPGTDAMLLRQLSLQLPGLDLLQGHQHVGGGGGSHRLHLLQGAGDDGGGHAPGVVEQLRADEGLQDVAHQRTAGAAGSGNLALILGVGVVVLALGVGHHAVGAQLTAAAAHEVDVARAVLQLGQVAQSPETVGGVQNVEAGALHDSAVDDRAEHVGLATAQACGDDGQPGAVTGFHIAM
ncbi:hypothetical protein PCS70012_02314, partial [Streptococcus pneumoniae PCS70012]